MTNLPHRLPNTHLRYQAVLFDLDGTLLDSAKDLAYAANLMLMARGLATQPTEAYRPLCSAGTKGMLRIAFGDNLPEGAELQAMRTEYLTNYARCMTQTSTLFPGIASLLTKLEQKSVPWGIVTNKPEKYAKPIVQKLPSLQAARVLISGDSTPFAKPHPQPLLEAAQQIGVEPDACIYIGDDERDIAAGRAAKMYTIAVAYGYGNPSEPEHPNLWGADAVITSTDELDCFLMGTTI